MPRPPQNLEGELDRAEATWPGIRRARKAFADHLAATAGGDAGGSQAHLADRYLAFACGRHDEAAMAHFERAFISLVPGFVARICRGAIETDEVVQETRRHLLVGGDGEPRILQYAGDGPLAGFLRVVAVRIALQLERKRNPATAPLADDARLGATAPSDPELGYLKERYGGELAKAFRTTLAELDPKSAAILQLHYLDGLSATAIGKLYQAHARTVQRWLAECRERILTETQRLLAERFAGSPSELASLAALLRSQVDVSFADVLRGAIK